MHYKMSCSIPGLYPLHANSVLPVTTKNVPRHCQVCPGGVCPQAGNRCIHSSVLELRISCEPSHGVYFLAGETSKPASKGVSDVPAALFFAALTAVDKVLFHSVLLKVTGGLSFPE